MERYHVITTSLGPLTRSVKLRNPLSVGQAMLLTLMALWLCNCLASNLSAQTVQDEPKVERETERMALLRNSKKILFLGDSITFAGMYVTDFETWLELQSWPNYPPVINAGLPSETVSGLSEDGHAGGKFPRPDLHERLARVLATTEPDLVIACYGINCGIYQPFDEQRFEKYQSGIRELKKQTEAAGAELILLTPPIYDDKQTKKKFSYDEVIERYSEWLLAQQENGWNVVDLHEAMASVVAKRRKSDPRFTFQRDGVHPSSQGHWLIAQTLIAWFGDESLSEFRTGQTMVAKSARPKLDRSLIRKRMILLRDATLSEAKHLRPGIKAGLPLSEATAQANALTKKIRGQQP